jgi:hypothetical protein
VPLCHRDVGERVKVIDAGGLLFLLPRGGDWPPACLMTATAILK